MRTAVTTDSSRYSSTGDRPAGRPAGWLPTPRASRSTILSSLAEDDRRRRRYTASGALAYLRVRARVESMSKWVNQCKHGTEVTADSTPSPGPRRLLFVASAGRAESCVYACQLSAAIAGRPAGAKLSARSSIIILMSYNTNATRRRNNVFVVAVHRTTFYAHRVPPTYADTYHTVPYGRFVLIPPPIPILL